MVARMENLALVLTLGAALIAASCPPAAHAARSEGRLASTPCSAPLLYLPSADHLVKVASTALRWTRCPLKMDRGNNLPTRFRLVSERRHTRSAKPPASHDKRPLARHGGDDPPPSH
jgi:hypothetical protein